MNSHNISLSQIRHDIRIRFNENLIVAAPLNTTIEAICDYVQSIGAYTPKAPIIAAICDGKLRELTYILAHDCNITPVTLASSDGGRIYRRSLVLLLVVALAELFPEKRVNVGYAVPDGGYYCDLLNSPPLTADEIARLETHMHALVAADEPITKRMMPLADAEALFAEREDDDKVRLLQYRNRTELVMYSLRGHHDYYFGYMVASTRYLTTFRLIPVDNGFILQYPRQENPQQLGKLDAYSKLSAVFQQADDWLTKLGVEDIGRFNSIVQGTRLQEMILIAEALHEQKISDIAQDIAQRLETGVKIVTIAGPSSSGKTTFSKRLAIQLMALGIQPFTVEMDNFFVDRDLTPRDDSGNVDFEALQAINLVLFNDVLNRLMQGEQVQLPHFDFLQGKSVAGALAQLQPQQIIILEGIHGLNTQLFTSIASDRIYRIYVSALTQLNMDRHNRVATTDVRLMRRIVRDANTRGYSAQATIARWSSVRRGEKRNIFPFQENADALFNSALVYELAALRPTIEPLLLQVESGTPMHIESNRLLSFLRWVVPFSPDQIAMIPDTSLLREFIGGSVLEKYHPGALS